MWGKEQKDMFSIIYGDDLTLVGDVVIARNSETKTCKVIDQNGNMLVNEDVYGIARLLGRGGFHYVILVDRKPKYSKSSKRPNSVSSNKMGQSLSNYVLFENADSALEKADYVEYTYKIFNSKFEYERVGKVRTKNSNGKIGFTIEVGVNFLHLQFLTVFYKSTFHSLEQS